MVFDKVAEYLEPASYIPKWDIEPVVGVRVDVSWNLMESERWRILRNRSRQTVTMVEVGVEIGDHEHEKGG